MARKELQQVSDPRVLRAIAHPVRNRILAELSAGGPSRAADIATQIEIPANQASFHLRQLAKYGLVEEAPELARDRRDRVWRMVNERGLTLSLNELEDSPGGKAAVTVFRRRLAAEAHDFVELAYSRRKAKDIQVMISDHSLRLTKTEAEEFGAALTDLVEDWRERTAGDRRGRRTYHLMQMLQPYGETKS